MKHCLHTMAMLPKPPSTNAMLQPHRRKKTSTKIKSPKVGLHRFTSEAAAAKRHAKSFNGTEEIWSDPSAFPTFQFPIHSTLCIPSAEIKSSSDTLILCIYIIYIYEWLSKPLLTLETIQHLRFPFAFWTFEVLGIMGYRSGILHLEFLAFFSAIRIEKKTEEGYIAFEISHRFTGFWHLMTGDIMNQTSEVFTDAHIYIYIFIQASHYWRLSLNPSKSSKVPNSMPKKAGPPDRCTDWIQAVHGSRTFQGLHIDEARPWHTPIWWVLPKPNTWKAWLATSQKKKLHHRFLPRCKTLLTCLTASDSTLPSMKSSKQLGISSC